MPPVKTYTRKSSVNRSRIEIVNSFMYQNNPIKKRKNKHKKKIVIQDLPARTTQCMLTNSFLDVKVDDTFDRLLKEYKKDQPEPVNEPKKSANKTPNITVENCSYSPIMTRHRSLTLSRSNNSSIEKDIVIQDVNKSSKSEASNSKVLGKERTLDRSVTNSLYIEKVKPKGHSTISLTEIINNAKMSKNTSCKMMFSDSFKKKYRNNLSVQHNTVISSTPIVDINRTDISVAISPIKNITNENLDVNSIVMFKTPKNVKRRPVRRISVANPSITKSVLLGSSNYDKSGISKDIFDDSSNIRVLKDVSNVTCDSIVKNDNQSAINENLNDYNEDLKGFESTDCNLLDSAHYLHLKEAISLMEKTLPESNSKCAITESKIETSSKNDNTDCILINNTKTQNSINTCDLQQSLKDIHFSSFEDIKSVSNLESTSTNKKYLDQTKNTTNSEKSSVANIDSASRDLLAFHRYITLRKRRITIKPYIKKRRKNRGGISGNDSSYWENSGTSFCKTLDSEIVNSGYICENGTNGQSVYDNEKSITDENSISIDTSKEQSLESTNETNESNLDHSKLERLAVNEDISMDDGNSLDQTDLDHTKLGREAVVEITPLNLEMYIKQSEPKANSKQIMLNDLTSMESTNLGNEKDESDLDHSKLERSAVNEDISVDDGNSLDQTDLDHTKLGREAIVEVTSLNLEMYIKPKANSKQIMLNDPKLRQDPVVYVQCLNLKQVIPAGHSVDFISPDVESKRSKSLDISSESELDHSAELGSSANTTEDTSHSAELRSSANTTEVTSHCIRTRSKTLKDEHRQAEQSQTNSRNLHEQRDSLDVSLIVPVSDSPAAAYEQKGQTFKKDITQLKGRSAKSIVIVSPDVEIPKNEGKSEAVSRGHTETRESDIQLRKLTRSRASTLGRSSRSIDIVSPDIEIPENEGKSVSATPPIRPLTKSRVSKKSKVSQRNAQRNLVLQTGLGAPIRDPDDQNKVFLTPKIPRRRTQRKTTLATLDESLAAKEAIMRSCKSNELTFKEPDVEDLVVLKPGKLWRRSLLEVRNSRVPSSPGNPSICVGSKGIVCTCIQCKRDNIGGSLLPRRLSVRVVPLSPISPSFANISYLENYAVSLYPSYVSDGVQESALEDYIENLSLNGRRPNPKSFREQQHPLPRQSQELGQRVLTARDVVLRKCKQTEPLPFQQCYPNSMLQHCQKIGEGVYGEVFLFRNPNGGITVMKIIPIEGSLIVNGERQKKYEEILSEITITMELSNLRNNVRNNTNGFAELQKVTCVRGKYPDRLLELWDLYEESHGTENESPEVFEDDQLYIILELANGGKDMEAFVFNNAQQAFALFQQIACALAVAEASLEFEHRDLHWGNLLISNVDAKKTVTYYLNGKRLELDTKGVQLAIIDYTLSRIKHEGICIYNDLSLDPDLFNAKGDYQFDIYRLMRECNKNDWQIFQPYTNVLWLHYVLSKMIAGLRYKNKNSKVHKEYLKKLQTVKDEILGHKSAQDFVTSWILLDND